MFVQTFTALFHVFQSSEVACQQAFHVEWDWREPPVPCASDKQSPHSCVSFCVPLVSDFSRYSSNGEITVCGLVQSWDVCVLENYRLVTWPRGRRTANVKSLVGSLLWIHLMIHDSLSFKISIFIRQYLTTKAFLFHYTSGIYHKMWLKNYRIFKSYSKRENF